MGVTPRPATAAVRVRNQPDKTGLGDAVRVTVGVAAGADREIMAETLAV